MNSTTPSKPITGQVVLSIFGASGDLTKRKLIPALINLWHDGLLPKNLTVLGLSRTPFSDEEFRGELSEKLGKFLNRTVPEDDIHSFLERVQYLPLNARKVEDFETLKEKIKELLGGEFKSEATLVFYLATASKFFVDIAENAHKVGLVGKNEEAWPKVRFVVEKPFGEDLASAQKLNEDLTQYLEEPQIYRIDHYLGKETVQNILVTRFCNTVFEPLWNSRYVEQIQISVCESIGVPNRGSYFDHSGITRDIVQNHVMQILSLLCIEPPVNLHDAQSIRDEKVKVLQAIRRWAPDEIDQVSVRGQYLGGEVAGEQVHGYLQEDGVDPNSQTETYVALKLLIDNWRWAGVPIYIRAGKRLPKRITEISVWFRQVPEALLRKDISNQLNQNVLSIQVQPREGMSLSMNSKLPGQSLHLRPVELDFSYAHSFSSRSPDAYERLLLDVFKGDATLFTRDDEIEQAWDVLAPFFEGWNQTKIENYSAGTWGPESASKLFDRPDQYWKDLCKSRD